MLERKDQKSKCGCFNFVKHSSQGLVSELFIRLEGRLGRIGSNLFVDSDWAANAKLCSVLVFTLEIHRSY